MLSLKARSLVRLMKLYAVLDYDLSRRSLQNHVKSYQETQMAIKYESGKKCRRKLGRKINRSWTWQEVQKEARAENQ